MRTSYLLCATLAWVVSAGPGLATSSGLRELTASADAAAAINPEATLITVSLDDQRLKVFDGINEIAESRISSGKTGHSTPTGIFTILQKSRHHRSNIYSGAPMPYMQRLTWSGIALHESSSVPAYPASHGCVRMPGSFAKEVWTMTSTGDTHVVIAPEPLAPRPFDHPAMFRPADRHGAVLAMAAELRTTFPSGIPDLSMPPDESAVDLSAPIRIYATRSTGHESALAVQEMLQQLGFYVDELDGLYGRMTIDAMKRFQESEGLSPNGAITDEALERLHALTGRPSPAPGRIYVRRKHETILEADIGIIDPQKPLGAHLAILQDTPDYRADPRWISVSMSQKIPDRIVKEHEIETGDVPRVRTSLGSVLDRLEIEQDVRDRIESMLTPGSSLAISDNGLGTETGKGTDFIVQIH